MSLFNEEDLFGSGPRRFTVAGLAARCETHDQPGADGQRLTPLGLTPRKIEQAGVLMADDAPGLGEQLDAIESALGARPADLVDHLGRTWPNVIMLMFKPGGVRRIAGRLAVEYQVFYEQVQS